MSAHTSPQFARHTEPWIYGYRFERDNRSTVEVIRCYVGEWSVFVTDSRGRVCEPFSRMSYIMAMAAGRTLALTERGTTDETSARRAVDPNWTPSLLMPD